MSRTGNLGPTLEKAFAGFAAIAGLVGVAVTVWTAPSTTRTVSLSLLFGGAVVVGLGACIPDVRRRLRAKRALPSVTELKRAAARYSVVEATPAEIAWIAQLEAFVYSKEDAIPERVLQEWYSANPTGFSIIKAADETPIGHLDILPIRPQTLEAFVKGDIVERDIRGDSLYKPAERGSIKTLYVESIILRPPRELSNAFAVVSVLSNIASIITRVADVANIERIYAIAATDPGADIMRDLGFELHCGGDRRKDGHDLFTAQASVLARKVVAICGSRVLQADVLKSLTGGL